MSYPIGQSTDEANAARGKLERAQSEERFKGSESRAIQQIRNAAYQVEMNAKRIETTRAARELAEQRLDSERKRLDVAISTNFLVIEAQRGLSQARSTELGAVLSYDLALVTNEGLQKAAPAGQGGGSGVTTTGVSGTVAPVAAPAGAIGASTTPTTGAAGTRT